MYGQGEVSRCMAADIGYGKLRVGVRVRVRARLVPLLLPLCRVLTPDG